MYENVGKHEEIECKERRRMINKERKKKKVVVRGRWTILLKRNKGKK
jgi:hypothetical protein